MEIKAGDIIGFSGSGFVSDLINVGTFGIPRWHLSHVGIVVKYRNELLLFESTSLAPAGLECRIQKRHVKGVQAHTLPSLRKRPGRIWLYPLYRELFNNESQRLMYYAISQLGKDYDMLGAGRAGGGLFLRWARVLLRNENLDDVFCSEFAAAAESHIGVLPTGNASSYSPNGFVRRARRAGVLKRRVRFR